MKIICIQNTYEGNEPRIFTVADSSLLKDSKPFFLPDPEHENAFALSAALRICRLGRKIARKFASRYYDAAAPAINFIDMTALHSGCGEACSRGFDGSVVCAPFLLNPGEDFSVKLSDGRHITWNACEAFTPEEAVESASRFFTLKTGDIILHSLTPPISGLTLNTHIDFMNADGEKISGFNVK